MVTMEVYTLLFLTCVAVNSVSGQFSEYEYRLDSVPFPIRRRLSSAKYEVHPSSSREIEYQDVETARTSSQGRRHIGDNQRLNIQNEQRVRHDVNNFGTRPYENQEFAIAPPADRQPNHNRGPHVGDDQQLNVPIRQQNQETRFKGSSIEHVNKNIENQNNGEINPTFQEPVLKTNLPNTHSSPSRATSMEQRNYETYDNARTNLSPTNQQSGARVIDNSRRSESSARTNANNKNVVKASPRQDSYNQQNNPPDDNRRTSEHPTNQQTERIEPSGTRAHNANASNKKIKIDTPTLRSIDIDNRKRQSVDSTRTNNNRNNEANFNNQNTGNKFDNRNENNRHTTEPTRRNTIEDRAVTSGTKSTHDNELESGAYPEGRSGNSGTNGDDKWIWNDVTTLTTTLPEVDDRAAFAGDKCPTGQVRFNKKCVNTDP